MFTMSLDTTDSGRLVRTLPLKARTVAFSSDGQLIASGTHDGNIQLWQTSDATLLRTWVGRGVYQLVFSPDNTILVSISGDKAIRVWQVSTGHLLNTLPYENSESAIRVAISPNSQTLAVISERWESNASSYEVKLWSILEGREVRRLDGHWNKDTNAGSWSVDVLGKFKVDHAPSVAFSPDGQLIAVGSSYGFLCLCDVETGRELHFLQGHAAAIRNVVFSPTGQYLASGSTDGTVVVWK